MSQQPLDFIRYAADQALCIPAQLQLRPYTITMVQNSYAGIASGRIAPGVGTLTQVKTVITNGPGPDGYAVNPRYHQVSSQDIVLSGGFLKDVKAIIGPIVFAYNTGTATGGYNPLTFSPNNVDLYFNVQGPDYPAGGTDFKRFSIDASKNVVFRIMLMNTGTQ